MSWRHADEPEVTESVVRALIRSQCPQWAELPRRFVSLGGTDNVMVRLGDNLAVRLPRRAKASGQAVKEWTWLPRLARALPCRVPTPRHCGQPDYGFPWQWSVCDWLPGDDLTRQAVADWDGLARDLASVLLALWDCDPTGGPTPGDHNFWRGVPLAARDAQTRAAIEAIKSEFDPAGLLRVWEASVAALPSVDPPVWSHGDIAPGNILAGAGRFHALIDWGGLSVGDRANDVMAAWTVLPPEARGLFRRALGVRDDVWLRAKGWALSVAAIQLPYYASLYPALADQARRVLRQVAADDG
jgi:aminoglycoside phosphotransferase (APT) family kinase protein